jgi:hypothetical protein
MRPLAVFKHYLRIISSKVALQLVAVRLNRLTIVLALCLKHLDRCYCQSPAPSKFAPLPKH